MIQTYSKEYVDALIEAGDYALEACLAITNTYRLEKFCPFCDADTSTDCYPDCPMHEVEAATKKLKEVQ